MSRTKDQLATADVVTLAVTQTAKDAADANAAKELEGSAHKLYSELDAILIQYPSANPYTPMVGAYRGTSQEFPVKTPTEGVPTDNVRVTIRLAKERVFNPDYVDAAYGAESGDVLTAQLVTRAGTVTNITPLFSLYKRLGHPDTSPYSWVTGVEQIGTSTKKREVGAHEPTRGEYEGAKRWITVIKDGINTGSASPRRAIRR